MPAKDERDPVVIKKYANRRLYNTGSSTYVTLEDLTRMVRRDEEFVVHDAKTGDDITHSVLTQIIFELENNKNERSLLPVAFLRQLISFYGEEIQALLPSFLEHSLRIFAEEQGRLHRQMNQAVGGTTEGIYRAPKILEEQARRNLELFWKTTEMFASVPAGFSNGSRQQPEHGSGMAARENDLQELREQVAAMQRKIEAMTKN